MKIVNVSFDDHGNLAYNNAKALQSVGIDCKSYKIRKHPFGYAEESEVTRLSVIQTLLKTADIIQAFHSFDPGLKDYPNARKIVWHTGSAYRQNAKSCNERFNPLVEITLTDQCEFMELGANNILYVATAIDTDKIKPVEKEIKKPYLIGHYPSNFSVKGTQKIIEMMAELAKEFPGEFIFDCNPEILPHEQNLQRIAACDVYIEMFAPTQLGREYGCFGVTAFEAAAMGVVVVTQNSYPKVYSGTYGISPFNYADTGEQFMQLIKGICKDCSAADLAIEKKSARETIEKNHSYKATGERMRKLLQL